MWTSNPSFLVKTLSHTPHKLSRKSKPQSILVQNQHFGLPFLFHNSRNICLMSCSLMFIIRLIVGNQNSYTKLATPFSSSVLHNELYFPSQNHIHLLGHLIRSNMVFFFFLTLGSSTSHLSLNQPLLATNWSKSTPF